MGRNQESSGRRSGRSPWDSPWADVPAAQGAQGAQGAPRRRKGNGRGRGRGGRRDEDMAFVVCVVPERVAGSVADVLERIVPELLAP